MNENIIFDRLCVVTVFHQFPHSLLYLTAGRTCARNHSFEAKESFGSAECEEFSCFLRNFELMVAICHIKLREARAPLELVPEFIDGWHRFMSLVDYLSHLYSPV